MALRSERFRQLWARHDVHKLIGGSTWIDHPEVGPMHLCHEKFAIAGTDGQLLVIFHAEPDTESAQAVALLGTITAGADFDDTPRARSNPQRGATA